MLVLLHVIVYNFYHVLVYCRWFWSWSFVPHFEQINHHLCSYFKDLQGRVTELLAGSRHYTVAIYNYEHTPTRSRTWMSGVARTSRDVFLLSNSLQALAFGVAIKESAWCTSRVVDLRVGLWLDNWFVYWLNFPFYSQKVSIYKNVYWFGVVRQLGQECIFCINSVLPGVLQNRQFTAQRATVVEVGRSKRATRMVCRVERLIWFNLLCYTIPLRENNVTEWNYSKISLSPIVSVYKFCVGLLILHFFCFFSLFFCFGCFTMIS